MPPRVLPYEEWEKVLPVFQERGIQLPDPALSSIIAMEDESGVSFLVLQLQAHAEPLYIAPAHRGNGVHRELAEYLNVIFPYQYYAFIKDDRMVRVVEGVGMKELPYRVFVKESSGE